MSQNFKFVRCKFYENATKEYTYKVLADAYVEVSDVVLTAEGKELIVTAVDCGPASGVPDNAYKWVSPVSQPEDDEDDYREDDIPGTEDDDDEDFEIQ